MTATRYADLLNRLEQAAREKAVAEERFRKEAAQRAAELRTERAFSYRRLNLVRALGAGLAPAENQQDALAAGRRVLCREAAWTGEITPSRAGTLERFEQVILAVWKSARPAEDEEQDDADADPVAEFEAFEAWYREARGNEFLNLMEREVVELPLVEV